MNTALRFPNDAYPQLVDFDGDRDLDALICNGGDAITHYFEQQQEAVVLEATASGEETAKQRKILDWGEDGKPIYADEEDPAAEGSETEPEPRCCHPASIASSEPASSSSVAVPRPGGRRQTTGICRRGGTRHAARKRL